MPDCDVRVLDCENSATHNVNLDGGDRKLLMDTLEFLSCEDHISWYRRHYVKHRGYEMEVEPL